MPFDPTIQAPTRWLELDDCTLPYWRVGSGPDLVFVHGWPLSSATWRDVVPLLAPDYTCHVIDLPGAGRSVWSEDTRIGLRANCVTLRAAIDAIGGLERYALIGHDSGAAFARVVAAGDPRVAALVLGNTEIPGHAPFMLKLLIGMGKLPFALAGFQAMLRSRFLRRSAIGFGGCFSDKDAIDGPFFELMVKPLIEDRRALLGHTMLTNDFDWKVFDEMRGIHTRIAAPVQLIWGAEDPWFPLDKARGMVDQFGGGADLAVLSPGKLFVHEERPTDFVALARPILARSLSRTYGASVAVA